MNCLLYRGNEGIPGDTGDSGYWNGNGLVYSGVGDIGKMGYWGVYDWNPTCGDRRGISWTDSAGSRGVIFALL